MKLKTRYSLCAAAALSLSFVAGCAAEEVAGETSAAVVTEEGPELDETEMRATLRLGAGMTKNNSTLLRDEPGHGCDIKVRIYSEFDIGDKKNVSMTLLGKGEADEGDLSGGSSIQFKPLYVRMPVGTTAKHARLTVEKQCQMDSYHDSFAFDLPMLAVGEKRTLTTKLFRLWNGDDPISLELSTVAKRKVAPSLTNCKPGDRIVGNYFLKFQMPAPPDVMGNDWEVKVKVDGQSTGRYKLPTEDTGPSGSRVGDASLVVCGQDSHRIEVLARENDLFFNDDLEHVNFKGGVVVKVGEMKKVDINTHDDDWRAGHVQVYRLPVK